jgi:hypothetical protein
MYRTMEKRERGDKVIEREREVGYGEIWGKEVQREEERENVKEIKIEREKGIYNVKEIRDTNR